MIGPDLGPDTDTATATDTDRATVRVTNDERDGAAMTIPR